MTGKKFFLTSITIFMLTLLILASSVFVVDPFFHYRAPNEKLYYTLYEERSQNDGITRNFTYDSIITGTSMAENFKTSQFDGLFGTNSIKVCYSGATYKEINDNLKVAYASGHSVKYVLRPIDYSLLCRDKDELRDDMGDYPYWLTNTNPFDDVKYLLNQDVIVNYTLPVIIRYAKGMPGGYTSFDDYSFTGNDNTFGARQMLGDITEFGKPLMSYEATSEDMEKVTSNVTQNIVELAKEHPETTFLYFFPPYSMAYWGGLASGARLDEMLSFKETAMELMLSCDNIHVYDFTFFTDITANLDNYRDVAHYSPQINEFIIDTIYNGEVSKSEEYGRITKETYRAVLDRERQLLTTYDYNALLEGIDF
jgi:hypothetical protein